jgi:hypothetical protein
MAKPEQEQRSAKPPERQRGLAARILSVVRWRPSASHWPPLARVAISVAILLHFACVLLATYTAAPPFSKLAQDLVQPARPYINALDLNHGYRFFAPDPGPSHLIRYHLHWPDGHGRDGVFPNLAEERPRLLYHRYFMLAEHLEGLYEESQQFPEHAVERRNAEAGLHALVKSYADELMRRSGATQVRLELVEHDIPTPDEYLAGKRLDDARLFQSVDLGTFTRETP